MEIQNQFNQMKELQSNLIGFIDKEDEAEEYLMNLKTCIDDQNILKNREDFKLFLHLLVSISNDHYRYPNFFEKIERILLDFKAEIEQYFTNKEIFRLFKTNKRLLLFLVKQKIFVFDQQISERILMKRKYRELKYPQYFAPEVKPFYDQIKNRDTSKESEDEEQKKIEEEFNKEMSKEIPEDFDEKRLIGENDDHICHMIRNDMIEEFITFINQNNYPLNSTISQSIFETNNFLLYEKPPLIAYAAFYGSVAISKYLYDKDVELSPSLWPYAVHSDNPSMINFLEENNVEYDDGVNESFPYKETVLEAIKCHNNDVVNYIKDKYNKEGFKKSQNDEFKYKLNEHIISYSFRYYNFNYFPEKIKSNSIFFYFCIYGYTTLVKMYITNHRIDINKLKILNLYY